MYLAPFILPYSDTSVRSAITDSLQTVQRLVRSKELFVTSSGDSVFVATDENTVVYASVNCPTYWQTIQSNNQTTCGEFVKVFSRLN